MFEVTEIFKFGNNERWKNYLFENTVPLISFIDSNV
jgi:hypothetical protein